MAYVRELVINKVRYRITHISEVTQCTKSSEMKARFDAADAANAGRFESMHVQLDQAGQYLELVGVDVIDVTE